MYPKVSVSKVDGLLFIREVCGGGFGYVKQMYLDVGCFLSFHRNTVQVKTNTFSLGRNFTRLRGDPSEIYSESLLAENVLLGFCRLSPKSPVSPFLLRLKQVLAFVQISKVKDN